MKKDLFENGLAILILLLSIAFTTAFSLNDITGKVTLDIKDLNLTKEDKFFLDMVNVDERLRYRYTKYNNQLIKEVKDDGKTNHTIYSYEKNSKKDLNPIGEHQVNYITEKTGQLPKASESWWEYKGRKINLKLGVAFGNYKNINQTVTLKDNRGEYFKLKISKENLDLNQENFRENLYHLTNSLKIISNEEKIQDKDMRRDIRSSLRNIRKIDKGKTNDYTLENVKLDENGILSSYDFIFNEEEIEYVYSFESNSSQNNLVSIQ